MSLDQDIECCHGESQPCLQFLVAAEFIQAGDYQWHFCQGVACAGGFDLNIGQQFEGKLEFLP